MLEATIFNHLKASEERTLAASSTKDAVKALLRWMDSWLGVSYIDTETLSYAGEAMNRAGHSGVDRAVAEWLTASVDPEWRRLHVASGILSGCWTDLAASSEEAVSSILSGLQAVPKDSPAFPVTLLALSQAIRSGGLSGPLKGKVRQALVTQLNYLRSRTQYAPLAELIASIVGISDSANASHRGQAERRGTAPQKKVVTQDHLSRMVAQRLGISLKEARAVLKAVTGTITESLREGATVRLPDLGSFEIRRRERRVARNPRTGQTIEIAEHHVPTFRPGKELRDSVR